MYTYHLNLQRSTPTRNAVPSDRLPARVHGTRRATLVKEIKVDDSSAAGQLLARRKRSRRRTVHALWSSPARASNSDVRYSSVPSAAPGVASAHAFPNLAIKPFAGWLVPRRRLARLGMPAGRLPPGSTVNSVLNAPTGSLLRRGHEFARIFPFLVRLLLSLYEPTAPTPSRIQTKESRVTGRKTATRTWQFNPKP
jgi:hypothetical protein